MLKQPRAAVIGAGLCGLRVADRLRQYCEVEVFEKSRGLGGRMSTRRADGFQFDHGAQYFTARDPRFEAFLAPYIEAGVVTPWQARIVSLGGSATPPPRTERYVARPGMNGLCKDMGQGLRIKLHCRIVQLDQDASRLWRLTDDNGIMYGPYDWVVTTAPAEQSAALLPWHFEHHAVLRQAKMDGCYTLMFGGLDLSALTWDAAVVTEGPLAWIALNNSKPGRSAASSLVCQSRNDWANAHLEDDAGAVETALGHALTELTGLSPQSATYTSLHKWRFAKVATTATAPCLLDGAQKLAAAGDWCIGGRVEAAFLSAEAVSEKIIDIIQKATL